MSRLPYGKHLLRIKGQAPDGHWSTRELQLTVVVLKPFYSQQIGSIILAGLVFLAAGFFILRWRRPAWNVPQANWSGSGTTNGNYPATVRRAQSVYEFKNRFFANVSHEVRTPLTLILGPIGTLINSGELSKSSMNMSKLAQTNAQSLLKLVSYFLIYRKSTDE